MLELVLLVIRRRPAVTGGYPSARCIDSLVLFRLLAASMRVTESLRHAVPTGSRTRACARAVPATGGGQSPDCPRRSEVRARKRSLPAANRCVSDVAFEVDERVHDRIGALLDRTLPVIRLRSQAKPVR